MDLKGISVSQGQTRFQAALKWNRGTPLRSFQNDSVHFSSRENLSLAAPQSLIQDILLLGKESSYYTPPYGLSAVKLLQDEPALQAELINHHRKQGYLGGEAAGSAVEFITDQDTLEKQIELLVEDPYQAWTGGHADSDTDSRRFAIPLLKKHHDPKRRGELAANILTKSVPGLQHYSRYLFSLIEEDNLLQETINTIVDKADTLYEWPVNSFTNDIRRVAVASSARFKNPQVRLALLTAIKEKADPDVSQLASELIALEGQTALSEETAQRVFSNNDLRIFSALYAAYLSDQSLLTDVLKRMAQSDEEKNYIYAFNSVSHLKNPEDKLDLIRVILRKESLPYYTIEDVGQKAFGDLSDSGLRRSFLSELMTQYGDRGRTMALWALPTLKEEQALLDSSLLDIAYQKKDGQQETVFYPAAIEPELLRAFANALSHRTQGAETDKLVQTLAEWSLTQPFSHNTKTLRYLAIQSLGNVQDLSLVETLLPKFIQTKEMSYSETKAAAAQVEKLRNDDVKLSLIPEIVNYPDEALKAISSLNASQKRYQIIEALAQDKKPQAGEDEYGVQQKTRQSKQVAAMALGEIVNPEVLDRIYKQLNAESDDYVRGHLAYGLAGLLKKIKLLAS